MKTNTPVKPVKQAKKTVSLSMMLALGLLMAHGAQADAKGKRAKQRGYPRDATGGDRSEHLNATAQ